MKVNLGMNLSYAVKRWPEPDIWGRQVSERWALKSVEFNFDLLDPRGTGSARDAMCEEIRRASRKYSLEVRSATIGGGAYAYNLLMHPFVEFRKDALAWCELAAIASEKMGSRSVGGPVGAMSVEGMHNPAKRDYLLEEFIEGMRCFARVAALHNQDCITWEPTPIARELSVDIDATYRLYERMNKDVPIPILLSLNVGHQCSGAGMTGKNLDLYQWLKELGKISSCVRLQQSDGVMDRHWPMSKEYNDKGIVRMDKVLEALAKSGSQEVDLFPEIIFAFEHNEERLLEEMDETISHIKKYI